MKKKELSGEEIKNIREKRNRQIESNNIIKK